MEMAGMPSNPLGQFLRGVTYPIVALFFLQRHRLWRWAIFPVLINILLLAGLWAWGWLSVWPLFQTVERYFESMSADGEVMRTAIHALMVVMWILFFPVAAVMAAAVTWLVGHCVASPFLELLSEHVESAALKTEAPTMSWRLWRRMLAVALTDTMGGVAYLLATAVPLFLLSFIPVVGVLASVAAGAMLVAQQCVGLPLARQLISYGDRWRMVIRHRWFCLGFGTAAVAMLAAPGLNLILLPLATAAGTLLYCDLKKVGGIGLY